MPSRSSPTPPSGPSDPVIPPANEVLRRPAPNVIDQRQQQIDPAGRHRSDVNAPASDTMKQPGGEGPETAPPPATPPSPPLLPDASRTRIESGKPESDSS